ncbi:MAG TPA: hypothetical protein VFL14_09325 [Xanthomonadales bacterium]|nr:hypothetical protein [Xanthomonadales bacterium]
MQDEHPAPSGAAQQPATPAPRHWLRIVPALARAAIPIVGVTRFGWPLPVILFYFWIELALLALDTLILYVREGHASNVIELLLGVLAFFVPVFALLHFMLPDMSWPEAYRYLAGLLDTRGMRVAVALQVVVALVHALAKKLDDPEGNWLLGAQIDLLIGRFFVTILLGGLVLGVLSLAGIGMPGPGRNLANALVVTTVALVWAFGDANPELFNRCATFLRTWRWRPATPR